MWLHTCFSPCNFTFNFLANSLVWFLTFVFSYSVCHLVIPSGTFMLRTGGTYISNYRQSTLDRRTWAKQIESRFQKVVHHCWGLYTVYLITPFPNPNCSRAKNWISNEYYFPLIIDFIHVYYRSKFSLPFLLLCVLFLLYIDKIK